MIDSPVGGVLVMLRLNVLDAAAGELSESRTEAVTV